MFRFGGLTVCLLSSATLACSGEPDATRHRDTADAREEIHAVLDSIARAISLRNPVIYVSDGRAIRGAELHQVLENFYATQTTIDFRWDSIALSPLTDDVWTATAWARINLTDTAGVVTAAPAIFTWTVVRRGGTWQLAMAHKTTLPHQ
jgi:hypothetical protein